MSVEKVISFWFETLEPKQWYKKSDELDARISQEFQSIHQAVMAGETSSWRDTAEGRLAEVIVLDQFSRNMFRGGSAAFLSDPLALALAQEAVRGGHDKVLDQPHRTFFYMPYMHSESARVHETAMELFADLPSFDFELKHKAIIDQFGRYPHRNQALGRASTAEELEWMKTHSGF